MTVFVDDRPVYKIDERITVPGVNTAQDIPVGELVPGAHTIGFRLDPFTNVQSVTRISNIELGEVVNTPNPGTPNLQPTGISFDTSTAVVGGTIFFDSGVRNTGDADAGVFNIKWFVDFQEVGAYGSHAGVPAGQTVMDGNSQFSWTFDHPGTHSVTFTVDVDNQVGESNEEDNSTTTNVVVAQTPNPGTPNLQPTGISFDTSTAVVGGTIFFDSGVRNTGDADAGVFNIKWFVDFQEVGAYGSHAGVPAGQTVMDGNSQFSWTFDSPGTHSVTFTVDVDNQVGESNEEDNSTTTNVVVAQP